MIGLMNKQRISTSRTSQVWSFIRVMEFLAFIGGIFLASSVLAALQTDTSSAIQANKIFEMTHDVAVGKKFAVGDIKIKDPAAVLYIFGCRDSPQNTECSVPACSGSALSICVCEGAELHGCQTESYRYPVRGYVQIQGSSMIRIEIMDIEGVNSLIIQEVVS